jgi:hypothetical protein
LTLWKKWKISCPCKESNPGDPTHSTLIYRSSHPLLLRK